MAGKDPAGRDPEGKPDLAALAVTGETVHWHLLRAEHTQHIRALIAAATTRRKDADPEPWSTAYRHKAHRCAAPSARQGVAPREHDC